MRRFGAACPKRRTTIYVCGSLTICNDKPELPGTAANQLATVWRSVLLGVHRGGRQKAKAVQQIAQAIIENPAGAESLLPVLAAAVRSVRGPESRAALAAVVTVLEAQPQLVSTINRVLPELKLEEVAA